MIVTGPVVALAALVATSAPPPVCLPSPPRPGVGAADPFRPPVPEATALNADAKIVYRQGKWENARAKYRAAADADPDFLAPLLNIACSFVRQERFDDAVAEVRALLDRAYMPWAREVLEAADLGALKVQPQMAAVRAALASAAAAWGRGLDDAVMFVGRQRAPLRIPPNGTGEFILNPHQEVFAYLPETGRFRQLTADDGHVVAVARSADRRRLLTVTAQKWIRGKNGGKAAALDGVALRELTLATMTEGVPVPIAGTVSRIEVRAAAHGFVVQIAGARTNGWFTAGANGTLVPAGPARAPRAAVLTAAGAELVSGQPIGGACAVVARDQPGRGVPRVISVTGRGRAAAILGARFGAGLAGLPLP
ncbi:MAG: tetratricopeptide repeat protein [Polyangia bacterium]